MSDPHPLRCAFAALLVLAAAVTPAAAQGGGKRADHEAVLAALARKEILPLSNVLAIAQQRVPGDVVKVELERERTTLIYEVKILARDGRVREIEIDAKSGAVLKVEED